MSSIINVENLTKSFTGRKLFCEASFSVQEQEKIGIVGINGTGKSTLLRILAKEEEEDAGKITFSNGLVIKYLPQLPDFDEESSVLEATLCFAKVGKLVEASHFEVESKAKSLLLELGISDFEQKMKELSGGQKKKAAIAGLFLLPADVLLLDEPTNHLDYDMIEWLEQKLRSYRGALIMVTHDRYFLDEVCNRIVEIDKGAIYSYDENYSGFLEKKAQRLESERASERKRQSILRKEIEWMSRGARARSTKQKAHIQRYEKLRDQKGIVEDEKLTMSSVSSRLGKTIIEIENLSKSYESKVCVADFSYVFCKRDRVGFVGGNGCGKTTLMKLIAGMISPDAGSIKVGQTVKLGYYSQEIIFADKPKEQESSRTNDVEYMNPAQKVIDYIKDTAEYVRTEDGLVSASAMLERFLFTVEQQYSPIEKLSGGERRRLYLLRVLMEAPNVLILDEPTNDLDTQTLSIFEDYLDHYEGVVITVSHDRYFLDRVVERIFAYEGNGVLVQYEGGYTDYMAKRPKTESSLGTMMVGVGAQSSGMGATDSKATWKHEKKVKFSYQEAREYETIEADIAKLEEKIASLDAQIAKNASDYGKLHALTLEKEEIEEQLLAKMDRWEYLESIAEQL